MTLAAKTVVYNGVTLLYVRTVSWLTETIYDDSGLVAVALKTTATFQGLVRGDSAATFLTNWEAHRRSLMEPRQTLKISVIKSGTETVFDTIDAAGSGSIGSDVDQGPKPIRAEFSEFYGTRAAECRWTVSWTVPIRTNAAPVILSHRWKQTFNVDRRGFTTRVVNGTMTFSTQATLDDLNDPDSFRLHVMPDAIRGFAREDSQFVISDDNRTLVYQIVDVEKYRPPPGLAIEADGICSYSFNAATVSKAFTMTAVGGKYSTMADLVASCYAAMRTRISFITDTIMVIKLDESLFEPKITLSILAQCPLNDTVSMFPDSLTAFAALSSKDTTQEYIQPSVYGGAIIKAAAQAIFAQWTEGDYDHLDTRKAAVMRADNVPDATSGSDLPAEIDQSITVRAATAPVVNVADLVKTLESTVFTSSDQNTKNPYVVVNQSMRSNADSRLVPMLPAMPDAEPEIHQMGSPFVVEHHEGTLIRIGVPPVIPEAQQLVYDPTDLSGPRRGVMSNWNAAAMAPIPAADGRTLIYCTHYSYDVIVLDRPSQSGDNPFTDATFAESLGTVRKHTATLVPPQNPMLVSDTGGGLPPASDTDMDASFGP